MQLVKYFGADWCGDCRRASAFLTKHNVQYEKVDLVETPDAWEEVEKLSGRKNIPTLVFSDGSLLIEPSDEQLAEKLGL